MNKWKAIVEDLIGLGWTQGELAVECACAQSTISSIYQGKTKQPRADLALKLMGLLGAGARDADAKANSREAEPTPVTSG